MAKSLLRIKARQMRKNGESVRNITKKLGVSKSTTSYWVKDIILSLKQLERLRKSRIRGSEIGRLKGALMQKHRRLKLIKESKREGVEKLKNLTKKEFFVAGIAVYWAEGTKKTRDVKISNSDPKLIRFMIEWFRSFLKIKMEELAGTVGINEIHRTREKVVKEYWSQNTGIPLNQFRKTSFKKVKNKKVYENFNHHWGTLTVGVL